jgi:hypothetical protein
MTTEKPKKEKSAHQKRDKSEPREIQQTDSRKKLKDAFRKVSATEAGRDILKYLMDECGFKRPSIVRQINMSADGKSMQYGDILPNSTIYNETRRDVWLTMRQHIPAVNLNLIEMETIHEDQKK